MTSGAHSSGSFVSSKRSSKIGDNYLKELNEDLKIRKQELTEMLKPLKDKNNLLFQKLMSNLDEKQKSLQIMRQIMAGKECDESSVMELIQEAEEMKQNLEKKQRKMEWVKYQEQANNLQNRKVIELRIEALKNYQKANDLKLSLYLQQNFEPKQAFLNIPISQEALFSEVTVG
uniref:Coiled-coil domain containing 196 n=1 Tax=Cavia porcellus TaxID=10141 RepID=A0A286XL30_CAVPO